MKLRGLARSISALLLCLLAHSALAVDVRGLRMWPAPDKTRVVLDVSETPDYSVFTMSSPERVVIDIRNARASADISAVNAQGKLLRRVRHAARGDGNLRVVLDLHSAVSLRDSVLAPNREYGHRLVLDLIDPDPEPVITAPVDESASVATQTLVRGRDIIVAIDPGHGGEDPGALGGKGAREKDIVLAISRRLVKMINAERGMKAFLVRDGDYYVGLRERMERARKGRADLFVSIHADAFRDSRVHGSSVYVLSQNGASSEAARWLAERENSADFVGGVTLQDKDDLLKSVLLDLSQTAALEASIDVAARLIEQLAALGKVHKRRVQHAGFAVLKSPDIPSVLVETAFISNPQEERRLRDSRHQTKLAGALRDGIRAYFRSNPPPGTLLAGREHRVNKGETLSGIARTYQVSTDQLRLANNIDSDTVRVGETLAIP